MQNHNSKLLLITCSLGVIYPKTILHFFNSYPVNFVKQEFCHAFVTKNNCEVLSLMITKPINHIENNNWYKNK